MHECDIFTRLWLLAPKKREKEVGLSVNGHLLTWLGCIDWSKKGRDRTKEVKIIQNGLSCWSC